MPRELLMMQNSFQWEAIEGQTLGIENAIRSNARNLLVEGQTYQNFCTYEGEIFNNSGNYKAVEELTNLKSNTTYTVIVDLKSDKDFISINKSNIFRVDQYNINENGGVSNGVQGTITSTYQTFKFTFTTVSNFKRAILILRNNFHDTNVGLDSNTMYAKNIKVIEGNYTNIELPTSINGIESVAERESKNLLENVKWHDGMINNENGLHLDSDVAMYSDLIDIDINTLYHTNLIDNNGNSYRCRLYKADGSYLGRGLTASSTKDMYDRRANLEGLAKIRLLILNKTVTPLPSNPILLPNLYTEGDVNVKGKNPYQSITVPFDCKPNTNYNVTAIIESISKGDNSFTPALRVKTNTNVTITSIYNGETSKFNSDNNTQLVLVPTINSGTASTTECEANFKNIGIYESNLYPIKIAQSNNETDGITLPNGVKNSIKNGVYIRNIGKYTITGNEYYELRYQNDAMFTIQCGGLSIEPTFNDFANSNTKMICDKALCKRNIDTTFITDKLTVCSRSSIAKGFIIAIPKKLLSEYTIDKAKEYIKSLGGMTVWYQLATPITEPSTLTEVNIPIPLRSLPNGVRDTIEGNKLVQRVGMVVLDGSTDEEWKFESLNKNENGLLNIYIVTPNVVVKEQSEQALMCDKFPQQKLTIVNTTTEGVLINNQKRIWLRLYQSNATTVDEAKTYLSTNPITVYYELETPIEHTINVPRVPIAKGTNMVTTTNNIKPNLSMKYKKSKK